MKRRKFFKWLASFFAFPWNSVAIPEETNPHPFIVPKKTRKVYSHTEKPGLYITRECDELGNPCKKTVIQPFAFWTEDIEGGIKTDPRVKRITPPAQLL